MRRHCRMMMARRRLHSRCPLSPESLLVMERTTGTTATDGSSCLLGVIVSRKNRRALGTTSSAAFGPEKWRQRRGEGGGGRGAGAGAGRCATIPISPAVAPFSSVNNYKLPLPSWSLADLTLGVGAQTDAAPVLGREEVNKLCTLAHIELAPDGEGLDAAAVQRDVGAMLRCMQTMRGGEDGDRDGRVDEGAGGGGDVVEDEGPWGGAMKWQAPLHEDVVSDGDIQKDILGSAQRTTAGFFSAPRVVGGEETLP